MFSKDLEHTIGQCYKRAREARHEFMTVEHLLLALLDNPSAQAVLKACGADAERLRAEIGRKVLDADRRLSQATALAAGGGRALAIGVLAAWTARRR